MKTFVLFILAFIPVTAFAQTNSIVLAQYDSLYSNVLKEQRKIWVSLPEANEDDAYGNKHYPVIYVFDADLQVAAMVRKMEGGSGNLSFPKAIVVGIVTNANRTRDLTPTHSNGAPLQDSMSTINSGGGENFMAFIEKELIPYIDSKYPTAPYRMLMGHSLGGLMVINALVHHTKLFNNYVATEPSLWWDHQQLLKETAKALQRDNYKNVSLFLGIAHTQPLQMDSTEARNDTTDATIGIRSILKLKDYLNANKQNGLTFNYKYYPDYDHNASQLPAAYDALRFAFKFYNFNFPFNTFFQSTGTNAVLIDHYKKLSTQMGYAVNPPPGFVSTLAQILSSSKRWDRAFELLEINKANYPESYKTYEDLGDCYTTKGDKENAAKQYQKALSLKNSPEIKIKLDKLK